MNMIDEKDPGQESVKADSSDDEPIDDELIIDLTDEVIVETKDDDGNLELPEKSADDLRQAIDDDAASEVAENEEIFALDETDHSDSQEDETSQENDVVVVPDDQDAENPDDFAEDQLTASAMGASRGADQSETGQGTEEFDLKAFEEEDTVIIDNSRDEADENFSAMAGNETAAAQRDEDVFDLEQEIELEYALDDDEGELIELKDERTEDNQDFVDLMLGVSPKSDPSDDDEPTEYFEFETDEEGDTIVLDVERNQETKGIAPAEEETSDFMDSDDLPDLEDIGGFDFEDEEDDLTLEEPEAPSHEDPVAAEEETPQFEDSDGLPDLEAIGGFDFEDGQDAENGLALDEPEADRSDDIRSVERSLGEGDDRERVELTDEVELSLADDDDAIMDLDDASGDEEIILALPDEEPPAPEYDEDLLDLNGAAGLVTDDEIIPLDGFDDLEAENGEEIIEITEFDQHFPADSEALLKQSGILDAPGADEDDFLELIDIEEDSLSDDEATVELGDLAKKAEDADTAKINQFFNDDLENLLLKDEDAESIVGDTGAMKFRLDDEVPAVAEKASDLAPESTTDTEIPIAENENFDFDFDHHSIARQVDRLDTFLAENSVNEPETGSLPVDQVAKGQASELDRSPIRPDLDGLPAMPAEQINAAIEQVINEKFGDKIESVIYEVIEKAVAKEIDRLKGALIGNHAIEDYD